MSWPSKRPWSNAKPTVVDGIRFPSKLEARVYGILKAMVKPGDSLFRQCRLPLLSIAPRDGLTPLYLSVDFCLVRSDGTRLWVDAKDPSRRSREWVRGKAAAERAWTIRIETWNPK